MHPNLNRGTITSYINDNSIYNFLKNNLDKLNGKILDIGCGKMRYKKIITDSGSNKNYIGLDLEEGRFTYSVKADLYWDGIKIPLNNETIDSAIMFEVLEHCPDPTLTLKEAFRVLKKDSYLLITTPFIYPLHGTPYDFSRFTPYMFEKMLKEIGFRNILIKPSGTWDSALAQMMAIWVNNRPMPNIVKKLLRFILLPLMKTLLHFDKKLKYNGSNENLIMPGLLIITQK